MPLIPKHEREIGPAVITNPTAGMVQEQLGEIAGKMGEIVDSFDKAQRLGQYNDGVIKISQGLEELKGKYETDADFYTIKERSQKDVEDLKQKILAGAPNPMVAEALGKEIDQKSIYTLSDIQSMANKGVISDIKAKSMAAMEARQKAYLAADNEKERAFERERMEETIQAMVQGKIIAPAEAEAFRQKFFTDLERQQVFADLKRVGPEVVLTLLQKGEYDLAPETKFELEREIAFEIKKKGAASLPTDPRVEAAIVRKLYDPGGPQITQEDLIKYLGNGLSTDDFQKYSDKLGRFSTERPTTFHKRALRLFELARQKKYIDAEDWVDLTNEWERKCDEEKAKGERITQIAQEILEPYAKSGWAKAFEDIARTMGWKEKSVSEQILGRTPAAAPAPAKGESTFTATLPPAGQYSGKFATDTKTGKRYRSNSKEWIEIK